MELLADRYRLDAPIGQGAASTVHRAYDERTHRTCAIKLLRTTRRPGEVWRRFEREVQLMTQLRHPHILRVFDYDLDGPRPWMAMPLIRGGSVRTHLDRRGPLPLGELMVHGLEVLSALHVAHRAGVVHRDIKPSNLLKASEGLKVADFGIAAIDEDRQFDSGIGSIAFVAPEVDADGPSPASDLFSVGITLFVMATDGNPFDLANDGLQSRRMRRVPLELREIVHRATRADPSARYRSAREMGRALHRAVAGASFADLVDRAALRVGLADGDSAG